MSEANLHNLTPADLVRRAVMNAHARDTGECARWVAVMDTFALGSTYARDLCRLYGLDPDARVAGSRCVACNP